MAGTNRPAILLSRRVQHILDQNSIPSCGGVHQDVGHGANEFSILNNRATAHSLDNSK